MISVTQTLFQSLYRHLFFSIFEAFHILSEITNDESALYPIGLGSIWDKYSINEI